MTGYCLNQSQQQDLMDNNFRYTFRTFCKKSYNILYNSLKIQRSKNIGDTSVHCPAEAAQP